MVKTIPWKASWVWIQLATFSLIRIIVTVVLIITNILPFDAKPVLTFPSFVSFYRTAGMSYCCSATFWELVWVSLFIAWISGWATNVAFSMPGCASRFCQLMNLENSCFFIVIIFCDTSIILLPGYRLHPSDSSELSTLLLLMIGHCLSWSQIW